MKAKAILGLVAVVGLTTAATATVLWDQSNYDTGPNALIDQEFGDFPTYSSYHVTDVVADADWTVQSVSVFFTDQNDGLWTSLTQARLNVFNWVPGSLPLASDDPAAGTVVDVVVTDLGEELQITADNLDLDLTAGTYWVGLTPMADFGPMDQEFHLPAPIVNDNNAWRNPGNAFGFGTDWIYAYVVDDEGLWEDTWEASLLIEGIPAPGALALLGLAGLVSRRRR